MLITFSGATGRLQLMAKLAEGTGLQLPAAAANALHMPAQPQQQPAPPIATQCFLLSNMFDPSTLVFVFKMNVLHLVDGREGDEGNMKY